MYQYVQRDATKSAGDGYDSLLRLGYRDPRPAQVSALNWLAAEIQRPAPRPSVAPDPLNNHTAPRHRVFANSRCEFTSCELMPMAPGFLERLRICLGTLISPRNKFPLVRENTPVLTMDRTPA